MKNKKLPLSLIILLFISSVCAYFIFPHEIKTDMLSLLPASDGGALRQEAFSQISSASMGRVNILISSKDQALLEDGALYFKQLLPFETQQYKYDEILDFFSAYNYHFLSEEDREIIESGKRGALSEKALAMIYTPAGSALLPLDKDPLMLFTDYLLDIGFIGSSFRTESGFITAEYKSAKYIYIPINLPQEYMFSSSKLLRALEKLEEAKALTISEYPEISVNISGIPLHTGHTSSKSAKESVYITFFSFLIILLISIFALRSLIFFPIAFITIGLGFLTAFLLTSAVFGEIHVLTLLFGTSLIGLSIDYLLHFFVELRSTNSAEISINSIRSAIMTGFFTSIIGFAVILISDLSLLRQMAFFSMTGLLFVFLAILSVYPLLYSRTIFAATIKSRASSINIFLCRIISAWKEHLLLFFTNKLPLKLLIILPIFFWGIFNLQKSNDLQSLYTPSKDLLEAEIFFSSAMGMQSRPVFFFVTGENSEDILQKEEQIRPSLDNFTKNGGINGYRAVSQFIPSSKRQEENYSLISGVFLSEIENIGFSLGLNETVKKQIMDCFTAQAAKYLTLQNIPLLEEYISAFVVGEVGTLIMLEGVKDWEGLKNLENKNYSLLDRVFELNAMLEMYWRNAIIINLAAYLVIASFLFLRYGLRNGLFIILPSTISVLTVLALFGILGISISFLHIIALFLVLAFGTDYAVFQAENIKTDLPGVAILFSCLTTLSSFGMLAFSSFEVTKAFGETLLVGILAAFLFSPLATLASGKKCLQRKIL